MVQANRAGLPAPAWLCACMAGLLAGCSSSGSASLNPVEWWRGLQGGKIAEERPAPPGANDPNPNLGSIPERPTPTDPKFREQLANALIADRANAQHVSGPAADPSNPAAAPALFGRGALPPPGKAPPEPAKPAAAEVAPAAAPALPPSAGTAAAAPVTAAPAPAPTEAPAARPPAAQPTAELPALPAAPPPSANLPGAPSSAPVPPPTSAAAEVAASGAPVPAAPSAAAEPPAPVSVAFGAGSATLPRGTLPALRQLAARRGNSAIAVTGYGDGTSREPAAQSASLSLGLARGQAIANALVAAGVPSNIIRIDAEASGRGGTARLVD